MDAITAVGFAASILQFIDYTCHVLKIGKQIRRKGMSEVHLEIERSAELLEHHIGRIRLQQGTTVNAQRAGPALNGLAQECTEVANEIIEFVKKFKAAQRQRPILEAEPSQRAEHPDEPKLRILSLTANSAWNDLRKVVELDEEKLKADKTRLESLESLGQQHRREFEAILRRNGGKPHPESTELQERQRMTSQEIQSFKKSQTILDSKLKVDKARLQELYSSKVKHDKALRDVVGREDERFRKWKERIKEANEKSEKDFAARQTIKTLWKAIEVQWNKQKVADLSERLDRLRGRLYSEVMMNIQASVDSVVQTTALSSQRVEDIAASQSDYQSQSLELLRTNRMDSERISLAHSDHLRKLDLTAEQRHTEVVQLIESFKQVLEQNILYPALPQALLGADPSLNYAALNGYEKIENRILSMLHFRKMEVREAQVQDAYEQTCAWIFENPGENDRPWDNFREWLEAGNGCYWLEGKAGEFENNSNPEIFFACDSPYCTSSFERPSQLEEHRATAHGRGSTANNEDDSGVLSLPELRRAFLVLAKQHFMDFKICLLVDGLDEYVGNQQEIVDLFKTVTKNKSIKAVISSRPEPIFVESFEDCPKLRMENLTVGDIDHYIRTTLLSHSEMRSLKSRNPKLATKLIENIASKACGVFLWVVLVVRILHERLSDGIHPENLADLVEEYPDELHDLYEHMFARMREETRLEAFKLFRTVLLAHEVEASIPTALRLSYLERDNASDSITERVKFISESELEERRSIIERYLRSRCCGLLEIQSETLHKSPAAQHWDEGRIEFLHRTVSDFLKVPGIRQILDRSGETTDEEIYESLLASLLYRFKSWDFFRMKTPHQWKKYIREIEVFLVYCRRCESHLGSRQSDYLTELNTGLENLWKTRAMESRSKHRGQAIAKLDTHWAETVQRELSYKEGSSCDLHPLLSLAASFGLNMYVGHVLLDLENHSASFVQSSGLEILSKISKAMIRDPSLREHHIQAISLFAQAGFDFNAEKPTAQSSGGATAWEDLVCLQPSCKDIVGFEAWTELVDVYIKWGAVLDVTLKHFKGGTKRPTARELIIRGLQDTATERLSLEEQIIMKQGRERINNLLSNIPVDVSSHQRQSRVISLLPEHDRNERPSPGANGKRRRTSGRNSAKGPLSDQAAPVQASVTPSRLCSRCQRADALKDLGFPINQIHQAMNEAGSDADVPRLVNIILSMENDCSPEKTPIPTKATPPRRNAPSMLSSDSKERQWSKVTRKGKIPETNGVVGANWVEKKKERPRRAKTLRIVTTDSTQDEANANNDVIDLEGGTFTWSFTPKTKSSLFTSEQKELLRDAIINLVM